MSDLEHNSVVGKISLKDAEAALSANSSGSNVVNIPVTEVDLFQYNDFQLLLMLSL